MIHRIEFSFRFFLSFSFVLLLVLERNRRWDSRVGREKKMSRGEVEGGRGRKCQEIVTAVFNSFCLLALASAAAAAAPVTADRVRFL